jgi:hypothetical protein
MARGGLQRPSTNARIVAEEVGDRLGRVSWEGPVVKGMTPCVGDGERGDQVSDDLEVELEAEAETAVLAATAVACMWSVVDSLAVQWSTTAYSTGQPESGLDDAANALALERRDAMQKARAALERITRTQAPEDRRSH